MDRETAPNYFSYLLRLWKNDDSAGWYASLELPHDDTRRHFATLQDLIHHLEKETGERILPAPEEQDELQRASDPKPPSNSQKGA